MRALLAGCVAERRLAMLALLLAGCAAESRFGCPQARSPDMSISAAPPCGVQNNDFSGEPLAVKPGPFTIRIEESGELRTRPTLPNPPPPRLALSSERVVLHTPVRFSSCTHPCFLPSHFTHTRASAFSGLLPASLRTPPCGFPPPSCTPWLAIPPLALRRRRRRLLMPAARPRAPPRRGRRRQFRWRRQPHLARPRPARMAPAAHHRRDPGRGMRTVSSHPNLSHFSHPHLSHPHLSHRPHLSPPQISRPHFSFDFPPTFLI